MDLILKEYQTKYHMETSEAQKRMLKPYGLTTQSVVYYLSSVRACNVSGDPIAVNQKAKANI